MSSKSFVSRVVAAICLMVFLSTPASAAAKKTTKKNAASQAQPKAASIPVGMDYAGLVEKVLPSIVQIRTDKTVGSGFFVSDKGDILTNYHVIEGAREVIVTPYKGGAFSALIKDIDRDKDMALLAASEARHTPFLKISANLPQQGEAVMAVGNPQGLENTVSNGIVSAFRANNALVQFTAPISPGSSGGALINARGEVVGMPTLLITQGQNLNFAIAPNLLNKFWENARNKKVAPVKQDPIAKLRLAAERGDANSQYNLGMIFYLGKEIKRDYQQAAYWFLRAAKRGNPMAQHRLGIMYDYGINFQEDHEFAELWYRDAVAGYRKTAEQGDVEAQCNLGDMYNDGEGVVQNYKQAEYWYRKAVAGYRKKAERGDTDAQYSLGDMYRIKEVIRDYKQAEYWYRKAAEQGHETAQLNLGGIYAARFSPMQDYEQAAYWYWKAAEQGNALAQSHLGDMYSDGRGVEQSHEQAFYWYHKAAENDDMLLAVQYELGLMYYNGRGTRQDTKKAEYWWRKAAEKGSSKARKALNEMKMYNY